MKNVLVFQDMHVSAGGLDRKKVPDTAGIKQFIFEEDYENLKLLDNLPSLNIPSHRPVLFYPGCGADILFPLLYFEKLFPDVKEAEFIFNDIDPNFGILKTVLADVGVSFAEDDGFAEDNVGVWKNFWKGKTKVERGIRFYWNDILVRLMFWKGDVFNLIDALTPFDIYFEKAFRIIKDNHPAYEVKVFDKLKNGGILISDSGFIGILGIEMLDVPKELSSYKEMVIGIKREVKNQL